MDATGVFRTMEEGLAERGAQGGRGCISASDLTDPVGTCGPLYPPPQSSGTGQLHLPWQPQQMLSLAFGHRARDPSCPGVRILISEVGAQCRTWAKWLPEELEAAQCLGVSFRQLGGCVCGVKEFRI